MNKLIFFILIVINAINCEIELTWSDIISTTSGNVRGVINTTVNGVNYSSFKGIPYGEKPVRYQKPVAKARVSYIIEGSKEGANCMQIDENTENVKGSEDCLFLNVYTPFTNLSRKIRDLRAVLVWIHGGTFIYGSGDSCKYGPDGLIEHGIVVVTINYRLGALGWLLTDDSRIPGNAGLKDQLLALKWVRNNIKKFGGNANKVTLAGQSAGGASVTAHGVSDQSKGLFSQLIALSGTICNVWGFNTRFAAKTIALTLGKLMNNNKAIINDNQLIKMFNTVSAEELTILSKNITQAMPVMKCGLDLNSPCGTTFLKDCYDDKYSFGTYSKVPTLMGFTKNEVLLFSKRMKYFKNEFISQMNNIGPSKMIINQIVSKYVGKAIMDNFDLNIKLLIDIFSQALFQVGIDLCQQKMCSSRNPKLAPVYYYLFDFDAKNYSFHYQAMGITEIEGVSHEDELQYIWETCPEILIYPKDINHPVNIKKRQMTALIANFVKYGNPTPWGNQDLLLNVTWPNSCENGDHLLIQEKLSAEYERPIGTLAKALMPLAKFTSPLQSNCPAVYEKRKLLKYNKGSQC